MMGRVRFAMEFEVADAMSVEDRRDVVRRTRLTALRAGAEEARIIGERARARGHR